MIFAFKVYVPSGITIDTFVELAAQAILFPDILTQPLVNVAIGNHKLVPFPVLFIRNVTLKSAALIPVTPEALTKVTFRKVCPSERLVKFDPDAGDTIFTCVFAKISAVTIQDKAIIIAVPMKKAIFLFFSVTLFTSNLSFHETFSFYKPYHSYGNSCYCN